MPYKYNKKLTFYIQKHDINAVDRLITLFPKSYFNIYKIFKTLLKYNDDKILEHLISAGYNFGKESFLVQCVICKRYKMFKLISSQVVLTKRTIRCLINMNKIRFLYYALLNSRVSEDFDSILDNDIFEYILNNFSDNSCKNIFVQLNLCNLDLIPVLIKFNKKLTLKYILESNDILKNINSNYLLNLEALCKYEIINALSLINYNHFMIIKNANNNSFIFCD